MQFFVREDEPFPWVTLQRVSVQTAVVADSPGPGAVPLVHAGRAGLRGPHLFPLHTPAEMGGGARCLDLHRRIDCTSWILYVFN